MRHKSNNDSTFYPVSLQDLKNFVRINESTPEEDDFLRMVIRAAETVVENYTSRALSVKTYTYLLPNFTNAALFLPMRNASAVGSVTYYDTADEVQTLGSSNYHFTQFDGNQRVTWDSSLTAPSLSEDVPLPVRINYTAGYATSDDIEAPLRYAVLMLAAWFYNNRSVDLTVQLMPNYGILKTILSPYVI